MPERGRRPNQLDQAATVFQQEIATYPRDSAANGNLGIVYAHLGEYQKSLDVTRQALALAPQNYPNLGGRLLAMDEQLHWFAAQPAYAAYGIELEAETAAYFGHVHAARALTLQAVKAAVANKDSESAAVWEAIAAQREAVFGHADHALQMAGEAIRLAGKSPAVESEAALALALAAEQAHTLSLASELEDRFPLDTQMQTLWLAPIKAQVALEAGDAAGALSSLGTESTIELGQISFLLNVSCLYPYYVRGGAYLKAGQGAAAAAAFQTILDHKGIVWNCWTGPLAQLGLARAQVMQFKTLRQPEARDRAVVAYDRYLELWKNADSDVPVYRKAKAEAARLRGANPE